MKLVLAVVRKCILIVILYIVYVNSGPPVFSYSEPVSPRVIEANGVSTWKFTSQLSIADTDASDYDSAVSVKSNDLTICTIDLTACSDVQDQESEFCYCENDDLGSSRFYTLHVKKTAESKYSDKPIVLFLQKRDINDDTVSAISYENEKYPTVFEAIIVWIKEDGVNTNLKHGDNNVALYGSNLMTSVVQICATNNFNGTFTLNSEEFTEGCRKIADTSKSLSFSFTETDGMLRKGAFTVTFGHVCKTANPCNGHKCDKSSSSPGYNCYCVDDENGNLVKDKSLWTKGGKCNEPHACADSSVHKCGENSVCVRKEGAPEEHQCEQEVKKGSDGTRPSGNIYSLVLVILLCFVQCRSLI